MWRRFDISSERSNIVARCGIRHQRAALALLAALVIMGVTLVATGVATLPRVSSKGQPNIAQVISVSGQVTARLKTKQVALQAGDTVSAGWQVVTGVGSRCELEVPGPARITLGPTSAIIIAPGATLRDTNGEIVRPALRVSVGTVLVHVLKGVSRLVDFSIETPTAVAGVRGTMFDVRVAPSGTTQVSVWEGRVAVHGIATQKLQSNPVVISAGEEAVVQKTTTSAVKQPQSSGFSKRWQPRQEWLQEQKQWETQAQGKAKNEVKAKGQDKAKNQGKAIGQDKGNGQGNDKQPVNQSNDNGQAKAPGQVGRSLFIPPGQVDKAAKIPPGQQKKVEKNAVPLDKPTKGQQKQTGKKPR